MSANLAITKLNQDQENVSIRFERDVSANNIQAAMELRLSEEVSIRFERDVSANKNPTAKIAGNVRFNPLWTRCVRQFTPTHNGNGTIVSIRFERDVSANSWVYNPCEHNNLQTAFANPKIWYWRTLFLYHKTAVKSNGINECEWFGFYDFDDST